MKPSSWWEWFEDKVKPITLVGAFVLLLLTAAFCEDARADKNYVEVFHASNAGTVRPNLGQDIIYGCRKAPRIDVCIGASFASGEYSKGQSIALREQFGDYRFGIGYVTKQTIRSDGGNIYASMENMYASGLRIFTLGDRDQWELGLGLTYWQNTNRALGSNLNFGLSVGYTF